MEVTDVHNDMEMNETYTMRAQILQAGQCHLCVCDLDTRQIVLVRWRCACLFARGEYVCIEYDGVMSRSRPPQITASRVWHMNGR
jgi:hypothetical protein